MFGCSALLSDLYVDDAVLVAGESLGGEEEGEAVGHGNGLVALSQLQPHVQVHPQRLPRI